VSVGVLVGVSVTVFVGVSLGVGVNVGVTVGLSVGVSVGLSVGVLVGVPVEVRRLLADLRDGLRPAGVLHAVESPDSGTISFLNSDELQDVELREADATQPSAGGVLDVATRPGDGGNDHLSANAGTASSGFSSSGPLAGSSRRGTYFVGARKSYLGSLIRRVRPGKDVPFDYRDGVPRLDLPAGPRQPFVPPGK